MISGVYIITTPNGKRYVGSAVNFDARWRVHCAFLRSGNHHNRPLQAAFNKHGADGIRFSRLIVCSPEHAVLYEQIAMNALKPELNVAPVAGSTLGYRHTEETKAKFATRKRRNYTPEQRAAQAAKVRKPLSLEKYSAHVERMALLRGREVSQEARDKISEANKGKKRGPCSDEQKAKISAANAGRKPSQAALDASAALRKGVKQDPQMVARRIAKAVATKAAKNAQAAQ